MAKYDNLDIYLKHKCNKNISSFCRCVMYNETRGLKQRYIFKYFTIHNATPSDRNNLVNI
ncbi:vacuolar protein sorting complex subunit [Bacillus altitudinis]|nr:vacuolar protein sorting complex subunit [Bacillus pumilus]BDC56435.1 hypothetical protein TM2_31040 [Bacillus altitudinis]